MPRISLAGIQACWIFAGLVSKWAGKITIGGNIGMDAKEFRLWQIEVGMTGRQVAEALGLSENTISGYRRNGVAKAESPRIRLACAAIAAKLAPWYPR